MGERAWVVVAVMAAAAAAAADGWEGGRCGWWRAGFAQVAAMYDIRIKILP